MFAPQTRRGMSSFDPGTTHGDEPHNDVQLVAQRLANAKRTCTEIAMKDMKIVTSMQAAYDVQTAICFIVTKFNRHVTKNQFRPVLNTCTTQLHYINPHGGTRNLVLL
jgi:hypothetical protein